MLDHASFAAVAIALAASLILTVSSAEGADDAKYPSWKGQWIPVHGAEAQGHSATFDPAKPEGPGQQAPLTPEYQRVLGDSMAAQAQGGVGNDPTAQCFPAGMPRMMTYEAQEYVITQDVTY